MTLPPARQKLFQIIALIVIGLIICGGVIGLLGVQRTGEILYGAINPPTQTSKTPNSSGSTSKQTKQIQPNDRKNLDRLTDATTVARYIKDHGDLPEYYTTKAEAERAGWNPGEDVCQITKQTVIGGDYFSNFEQKLPTKSGRKWYEADVNYHCGHRGTDRLLYSNDRLTYLTTDHYATFTVVN
jgi:hypothetical protein